MDPVIDEVMMQLFADVPFAEEEEDLDVFLMALEGQERQKNVEYLKTISTYTDEDFRKHFRLSRSLAWDVAQRYERGRNVHQEGGDGRLTCYEQVLVFLWFAGHEAASFEDVADRFGIAKSTLFKVIRRLIYFISKLSEEVIKWPNDDEKVIIERHFRAMGLPGIIGVVDGSHVRIDKPSTDPDAYYNRKKYHSIQLQAVCDHERRIRSVFIGFPGSVHDACVFNRSLGPQLHTLCGEYCIAGDSAYPCKRNVITPFKDTGNLNAAQKRFNKVLSSLRITIEHCFGLMKQRFRQLYHCKLRIMKDMVHFIRAVCVLHNLCLEDHLPEEGAPPSDGDVDPGEEEQEDNNDSLDGRAYRDYLVRLISS